jgi:hypothetical protein
MSAPFPRSQGAPADTGLDVASIAGLVSHCLCGLHRVNDDFVRIDATLDDDGYIALDVTRIDFTGEDSNLRVLLYPTATIPAIRSAAAETVPGQGAA